MNNKKKIIILIILVLFFILGFIVFSNRNIKKFNYDYTNKIFSSNPGSINKTGASICAFTKNGNYYYFVDQYDEGSNLRANIGTWRKEENGIYVKYKNAIWFKGGELVETDDQLYYGMRRINYNTIKINYPYDTLLNFKVNKAQPDDLYGDYITIDGNTYFEISAFSTEEELSKKLEEMYGEIYTMLVDDSIEAIDNNTENNEDIKEDYTTEEE